jgi:SAM-dependent methyltransferase
MSSPEPPPQPERPDVEDAAGSPVQSPHLLNRESYDEVATLWDGERRSFYGSEREYLNLLIGDSPPGSRFLDLGCGTGRPMAEYLIARECRVTGVDQAWEMLVIARARFPGARWIESSIEAFLPDEEYDAALLWDSLFHIERSLHERILRTVFGALRRGGRVMMTVGGSENPPFTDTMLGRRFFYDSHTPEVAEAILRGIGYRIVLGEFMNRPSGGRDRGRYAIVAERPLDGRQVG